MPSKTEEYLALAQRTANGLTRYWESWTDYLTTASRLYKYPFADQLMIYAQRPDATACADYDVWNSRMNRYVRRGAKGIALLDESSGFPRLHYVFDVSDTGVRRNSRDPEVWQYNDDLKQPVSEMLSKTYGISGERVSQQLADVAGKLVADYWDNNGGDIRAIVDGSLLMDYDDAGVEMQFKSAARHRRSRCRCSAGCACGISWPAQKCYRPKACGSRLHPWLFPPGLAVKPSYLIRIPHPHPGCKRDLPPNFHDPLLNDSKQMSERNRDRLRPIIEREAVAWAVAAVPPERIDEINILNASFEGMCRAVGELRTRPEFLAIDGNRFRSSLDIPYRCIVKGDGKYADIAAASVLAKTHRDEYMRRLAEEFPQYGWAKNKGYPTREHRLAVRRYGVTPYHRLTFNHESGQLELF